MDIPRRDNETRPHVFDESQMLGGRDRGLPQFLIRSTQFPDDAGAATETTIGVSANDEVTGFTFDHPTGLYTFDGGGSSLTIYLDGSIDATTLATVLGTLYGSDNTTFTLTSGDESHGVYTIEFVNGLSDTPLAGPPYVQPASAFSGSATFTNLVAGFAGVQEVQIITLPTGLVAGTWQINGSSALAHNTDSGTVQSDLNSLGQSVTVTGDDGGPYTVTWTYVGVQDLLDVESIDLQVPNHATVTTTHPGASSLIAHYDYDAWGKIVSVKDASNSDITDPAALTSILYAGYRHDWATGLDMTWTRPIDASAHVFLQPDPIQLRSGQVNFNIPVGDNPLNGTDPSGEWSWKQTFGVIKAVGGVFEVIAGASASGATGGVSLVVALHGIDTIVSGVKQAANFEDADSYTSKGLQLAGMSKDAANLTDAGISVVGTLGVSSFSAASKVATVASTEEAAGMTTMQIVRQIEKGSKALPNRVYDNLGGKATSALSKAAKIEGGAVAGTGGIHVIKSIQLFVTGTGLTPLAEVGVGAIGAAGTGAAGAYNYYEQK